MTRTVLSKRTLPNYTKGEEIFNMVSHIVGGAFSVAALVIGVIASAFTGDVWKIVSVSIYGATLVIMYTISSVYHGLNKNTAKKVMQVIDHCDIYFLIAGTYTPILLCAIRPHNPAIAWTIFGVEWGLTALAVTLNAIDLKKFSKLSMTCYIGMGWCIVAVLRPTIDCLTMSGFWWLLMGGVAYTIGAVLYGVGKKVHYMHCVFHIFVVIGSVLQYIAILKYVI
ncbi:MAG: hemolysin III family protein [Ruminococcaceae bacterium]|nr:hemolysin III family protein [Oscillospiraceae bacterium]